MIYSLIYNSYLTTQKVDEGPGVGEEDPCKSVPGTKGTRAVAPHLPSCQPPQGGFLAPFSRPGRGAGTFQLGHPSTVCRARQPVQTLEPGVSKASSPWRIW